MGAVNSCCIPRKSCDCGGGSRNGAPRGKLHRKNLSETFNLSVVEDPNKVAGGVNINAATEEELMTLPGISRIIAKNIIDYRNQLGGFRCVEDLALASGVGAERLSNIRHDIYVMPTANGITYNASTQTRRQLVKSSCSVKTQTPDLNRSTMDSNQLVNVNRAKALDLVKVKNIGPALADNIVEHRDRLGEYKSLKELTDVKGIGPVVLEEIKPFLCVLDGKTSPVAYMNGTAGHTILANSATDDAKPLLQRSSSMEWVLDMLGPSEDIPPRPRVPPISFKYKNRPVVRVASWNVEDFGLAKSQHPGVVDVLCMTILENGLGIVAFQELTHKDALKQICQELNHPSLPNVKKWKGWQGQWECVVSEAVGRMFQGMEYSGFLYDKSQNIEHLSSAIVEKPDKSAPSFTRKPFLAAFKINGAFDCILISVHLKATGLKKEDMKRTKAETDRIGDVIKAVRGQVKDENDVIIMGDFNLDAGAADFEPLRQRGYSNCIPSTAKTNIGKNNPDGTKNYDNIWVSKQTRKVLTGEEGFVIREGLWSPWIPYNWGWGGYISDHCPVFTQIFTSTDLDNGDIQHSAKTAHFTV